MSALSRARVAGGLEHFEHRDGIARIDRRRRAVSRAAGDGVVVAGDEERVRFKSHESSDVVLEGVPAIL